MTVLRTSCSERESAQRAAVLGGSFAIALLLAALVVSGCSGAESDQKSQTTTAPAGSTTAGGGNASITLLEAAHTEGPWTRRLSLRLGRGGVPAQFYVCAVRGQADSAQPCGGTEPGRTLPAGSTLRLE